MLCRSSRSSSRPSVGQTANHVRVEGLRGSAMGDDVRSLGPVSLAAKGERDSFVLRVTRTLEAYDPFNDERLGFMDAARCHRAKASALGAEIIFVASDREALNCPRQSLHLAALLLQGDGMIV